MALKQSVRFDLGRRLTEYALGEPDRVVDGARIHLIPDDLMSFAPGLHGAGGAIARLGLELVGREPAQNRTAYREKQA